MDFRKNSRGITLIALVITIIVLLILAGVSLSLVAGGDGILGKAESAVNATDEAKAREKLEILLAGILADKYTDENYNAGNYIDEKIIENEMIVSGNVITVDGWQFEIDRSKPKIINALGKGQESEEIEILTDVQYNSTFSQATIKFTINYEGNLKSIQINGENQEILSNELTKTVDKNGTYQIYVKDENDAYKLAKAEITELAEDMEIRTPGDLVAFRDKVNKGATFEGKTVTLMNDLDLSEVCSEEKGSWTSIGLETAPFKGTFDGNRKKITCLYMAGEKELGGLFGWNEGQILNLVMADSEVDISSPQIANVAMIVGVNKGKIFQCGNQSKVTAGSKEQGRIGGIVGINYENGTISECYNKGLVFGTSFNDYTYAGGIVGLNLGIVENCYNRAEITNYKNNSSSANPQAGGITGETCAIVGKSAVNNCYSTSEIKASVNAGNISGCFYGTSKNTYWLENVAPNQFSKYYGSGSLFANHCTNCGSKSENDLKQLYIELGDAYKEDKENINDGYPILKWE